MGALARNTCRRSEARHCQATCPTGELPACLPEKPQNGISAAKRDMVPEVPIFWLVTGQKFHFFADESRQGVGRHAKMTFWVEYVRQAGHGDFPKLRANRLLVYAIIYERPGPQKTMLKSPDKAP